VKRVLVLLVVIACAAGCGGPASQSGVWKHETLYKNTDHMVFSWGGSKNATSEDALKSTEEGWWGKEVPVAPGK
jgi:hypothetical protein